MNALAAISENKAIDAWTRHFTRSPFQINAPHTADAELLDLPDAGPCRLAATIDAISEEIARGIYKDPFTMGWVTIMASASDLAAVGSRPLGFLISVSLEPFRDERFRDRLAEGMAAACRTLGVYILGGDTNVSETLTLTGCGLGLAPLEKPLSRIGCRPGDAVFLSGGAGRGNALGLRVLAGMPEAIFPETAFRPIARIKEASLIAEFASCAMDTSDGLLITLDQLSRLNGPGFSIAADWERILAEDVSAFCRKTGFPPWFMAAGIHGEFELVFTIPDRSLESFRAAAASRGSHFISLGVVRETEGLGLVLDGGAKTEIDMAPLRNLWSRPEVRLSQAIEKYHAWGRRWRLEP